MVQSSQFHLAYYSGESAQSLTLSIQARWTQQATTVAGKTTSSVIGLGGMIFLRYVMATPYLFQFWGNTDWMPLDVAQSLVNLPWSQSILFYFSEPWHWIAFHALFVFSIGAFTLGWRTSWVKWIVLIGHISYDHRNITLTYGVHGITADLLLVMCFAPIGRAMLGLCS